MVLSSYPFGFSRTVGVILPLLLCVIFRLLLLRFQRLVDVLGCFVGFPVGVHGNLCFVRFGKHGVRNEINTGYVQIIICLMGNQLVMEVKNSKPAVGSADAQPGIGQANALKRLALLYPQAHSVEIAEDQEHYEVHLTLNLKPR